MLASPLTLRTHDLPVRNKRLKVRTGCVTCKIRKVKCDEGKPACMRCTSTGRSCDGYAPVPDRMRRKQPVAAPVGAVARRSQHTRLQISASSAMVDASLLSHDLYPNERQWINVFSCKTGPALAGPFGETFWSHLLPQLSLREPAIRHAVMAVSFSHAHFEASMMASKVDARAIGSREFGLYQYNKAIARLQQHMDCESELEVPLVCSLLFICLECMYGNQTLMLSHLRNGLNILSIASSRPSKSSLALELRHIFHRLDAQSTLFGKPASIGMNLEAVMPLPVPTTFGGFDEAKRCLDLLITASLNFVQASRDPSSPVGGVAATERQTQLQGLFLDWEDALGALVALSTADHREKLLRIQFTASFIYLSTCLEAGETVYDSYLNSFIKLVNWARFVHTAPRGQPPSPFTLDINTIPPLFLTGTKCRHPIVRRQAVALLESSPNREGLWNARLHGRVARRIIEIEESSSVLEATDTMSLGESTESTLLHEGKTSEMMSRVPITAKLGRWVQEKLRVCDAEIHPIADGASVVKVTFYTAPQGMNGEWASWTEELSFHA